MSAAKERGVQRARRQERAPAVRLPCQCAQYIVERMSRRYETEQFMYDLPPERIAQEPVEPRSSARLLDASGREVVDRSIRDLPSLVCAGDLLVLNTTKVAPSRLLLRKRSGGSAEVLLLEQATDRQVDQGSGSASGEALYLALVRPGRRIRAGTVLQLHGEDAVVVESEALGEERSRLVRVLDSRIISQFGQVALPPYIHVPLADPDRYQTVYAVSPGSVAAPTAGLHLTTEVLQECVRNGARIATLDLSIGIGTFRPVTASKPDDHVMHPERYRVPDDTMSMCVRSRRVIAVGTTTLRALETVALTGEPSGTTELFVHGEFDFKLVDLLLTNFHQPRSSLLMLVESFYGPGWRDLYARALRGSYRFLSFGDAMLLGRGEGKRLGGG